MGISDFVTVTPKSKIFSKNSKIFTTFYVKRMAKICNFCKKNIWKLDALCNKGVWGVLFCYGALHIGVWGLKMAILGVT